MHSQGTPALALILAASAFAQDVNLFSIEKEKVLGAQYAKEILRRSPPVENPAAQSLVQAIGRRLTAHIPDNPFTYTFTVINYAEAREALYAPAGSIFIPAHLILAAQHENELAGLIAHAIAHIANRHMTRSATHGQAANRASIPLIYMGAASPHLLVPRSMVEFTRAFELDADEYGARLASASGYDPQAWAAVLRRIRTRTHLRPEDSPFPPVNERLARIASVERGPQQAPIGGLATVQDSLREPPRPGPSLRRRGRTEVQQPEP